MENGVDKELSASGAFGIITDKKKGAYQNA